MKSSIDEISRPVRRRIKCIVQKPRDMRRVRQAQAILLLHEWYRISVDTVEELRQALLEFKDRFNRHWLLQRHGYATPAKVRAAHTPVAEAA